MNKDAKFMRQWARCFALTHQTSIKNLAVDYFKTKIMELAHWIKSVKEGMKGDELLLLVLCLITGTHAFVHLTNNDYWTSLKE